MFRTRRGILWMVAGGVVAILAGLAAMWALQTAISDIRPEEEPSLTKPVVVASDYIEPSSVLSEADVEIRELPVDSIQSDALDNEQDAIGRRTRTELYQGEQVLERSLHPPPPVPVTTPEPVPSVADYLEEGEVAVALRATDLMSRFGVLQAGDKVDVLFSINVVGKTYQEEVPRGGLVSLTVVQDLEILLIVSETPVAEEGQEEGEEQPVERLIILRADPQEAVLLKYLKDSGGVIDFALRAPDSERLFDVEPVTINYLAEQYGIIPPEPLD